MDDTMIKALAREITAGKQDVPVTIRKGVLVSTQAGTPPTVTVNISGVDVPGVRFVRSYRPVVNDVVLMFKQGAEYLVFDAVAMQLPSDAHVSNIEIDGSLNHDGTTVGFFGTTPVTQQVLPPNLTASDGIDVIRARVNGITGVYLAAYGLLG